MTKSSKDKEVLLLRVDTLAVTQGCKKRSNVGISKQRRCFDVPTPMFCPSYTVVLSALRRTKKSAHVSMR